MEENQMTNENIIDNDNNKKKDVIIKKILKDKRIYINRLLLLTTDMKYLLYHHHKFDFNNVYNNLSYNDKIPTDIKCIMVFLAILFYDDFDSYVREYVIKD